MNVQTEPVAKEEVHVSEGELLNHLQKLYEINHKDLIRECSTNALNDKKASKNNGNDGTTPNSRPLVISFKRQPSTMDGSSRQPKKRHPKTYFSLEKRTICQDISSTSQKKYLEQLCQKKKDLVTNLSDLRVKLSYVVPERYVPPTYKSHWDFVLDEMKLVYTDVYEERKWKVHAAYRLAYEAQQYMCKKREKERYSKEELEDPERWSKKVCKMQSQMIQEYWKSIHSLNETQITTNQTAIPTLSTQVTCYHRHLLNSTDEKEEEPSVLYSIHDYKRVQYIKRDYQIPASDEINTPELTTEMQVSTPSPTVPYPPFTLLDLPSPRLVTDPLLESQRHPYFYPQIRTLSDCFDAYKTILSDLQQKDFVVDPHRLRYLHTSPLQSEAAKYIYKCEQESLPSIFYSNEPLLSDTHASFYSALSLTMTHYTSIPTIFILPSSLISRLSLYYQQVLPMYSITLLQTLSDLSSITHYPQSYAIYMMSLELFNTEDSSEQQWTPFLQFFHHFHQFSFLLYTNPEYHSTMLHQLFSTSLWNCIPAFTCIFEDVGHMNYSSIVDLFFILLQNFYASYDSYVGAMNQNDQSHFLSTLASVSYQIQEPTADSSPSQSVIQYKNLTVDLNETQKALYQSILHHYNEQYLAIEKNTEDAQQEEQKRVLLSSTLYQLSLLCNTEDLILEQCKKESIYIQPIQFTLPVCLFSLLYPSPLSSIISSSYSIFGSTIYKSSPFSSLLLGTWEQSVICYESPFLSLNQSSLLTLPSWLDRYSDTCDELLMNYDSYYASLPSSILHMAQDKVFTTKPALTVTGLYYNWIYNQFGIEQLAMKRVEQQLHSTANAHYSPPTYSLTSPKIHLLLQLLSQYTSEHKHVMLYIRSKHLANYLHLLLSQSHYQVLHFLPKEKSSTPLSLSSVEDQSPSECYWNLQQVYKYNYDPSFPIGIINTNDFEKNYPLLSSSSWTPHQCTEECIVPHVDITIFVDSPFLGNTNYIVNSIYTDILNSNSTISPVIAINTKNTVEDLVRYYYNSRASRDRNKEETSNFYSKLSLESQAPILLPWREQLYSDIDHYYNDHYHEFYSMEGPSNSYIVPQSSLIKDMTPQRSSSDLQKNNLKEEFLYHTIQTTVPKSCHHMLYYSLYLDRKYIHGTTSHEIKDLTEEEKSEIVSLHSLSHQYNYPLTYPVIDEEMVSQDQPIEPLSTLEKQLKAWEEIAREETNKHPTVAIDSVIYGMNGSDTQVRSTYEDITCGRNNQSHLGLCLGYLKNDNEDGKVKKQKKRVRDSDLENRKKNSSHTSIMQVFSLEGLWTLSEDELLKTLVHLYQYNWTIISTVMSSMMKKTRISSCSLHSVHNTRDCEERWKLLKESDTVSHLNSYKTNWMLADQKDFVPEGHFCTTSNYLPKTMSVKRFMEDSSTSGMNAHAVFGTPVNSFSNHYTSYSYAARRRKYNNKYIVELLKPVTIKVENYDNDEKLKEQKVHQRFCFGECLIQDISSTLQKQNKVNNTQMRKDSVNKIAEIQPINIQKPKNYLELAREAALSLDRCKLLIVDTKLFGYLLVPDRTPYDRIAIPSPYMLEKSRVYWNSMYNKNNNYTTQAVNTTNYTQMSNPQQPMNATHSTPPPTSVSDSPMNATSDLMSPTTTQNPATTPMSGLSTMTVNSSQQEVLSLNPQAPEEPSPSLSPSLPSSERNDMFIPSLLEASMNAPTDSSPNPNLQKLSGLLDVQGAKESLLAIPTEITSNPMDSDMNLHFDTPVEDSTRTPISAIGEKYNVNIKEENEFIRLNTSKPQNVILLSPRYQYYETSHVIRYRYPYQSHILEVKDVDPATLPLPVVHKRKEYWTVPFSKTIHYYVPVKSIFHQSSSGLPSKTLCDISAINNHMISTNSIRSSSNPISMVGTINDKDKMNENMMNTRGNEMMTYQRVASSNMNTNNNNYIVQTKYERNKSMSYATNKNQYSQLYEQNDNMHNPANNYANLNNYNTAQNKNQKYYTNYKK